MIHMDGSEPSGFTNSTYLGMGDATPDYSELSNSYSYQPYTGDFDQDEDFSIAGSSYVSSYTYSPNYPSYSYQPSYVSSYVPSYSSSYSYNYYYTMLSDDAYYYNGDFSDIEDVEWDRVADDFTYDLDDEFDIDFPDLNNTWTKQGAMTICVGSMVSLLTIIDLL